MINYPHKNLDATLIPLTFNTVLVYGRDTPSINSVGSHRSLLTVKVLFSHVYRQQQNWKSFICVKTSFQAKAFNMTCSKGFR